MNVLATLTLTIVCAADPPSAPGELRFEDLPGVAPSKEFLSAELKRIGGEPATEEELDKLRFQFEHYNIPSFPEIARLATDRNHQKEWDDRFRRVFGRPIRAAELLNLTRDAFRKADEHWFEEAVRDLERPKRLTLSGVVKNAEGTPLAGAEVSTHEEFTRTDSDGKFALHVVKPNSTRLLIFGRSAAGERARATVAVSTADYIDEIVLWADKTTRVFGVVSDAAGRPLPNAMATIDRSVGFPDDRLEAPTDSEGRFDFGRFPANHTFDNEVSASAIGFVSGRTDCRVNEELRIELNRAARVTGRVVGPDEKPLVRCPVQLKGGVARTFTDADGGFSMFAPVGKVVVEAVPRDFLPGLAEVTTSVDVATTGVEISCSAGEFTDGVLQTTAGIPAPHVRMVASYHTVEKRHYRYVASDENGNFHAGPLDPTLQYSVWTPEIGSGRSSPLAAGKKGIVIQIPD